ncbi:hypothetical protein PENTCL1PPCAC_28510 [Pristionchus entomophagus]|uniref:Uncharacterized protein n=1 Tax=Pristionchus entomophagus TaxID=358040 RepID=A0AAV5UIP0_9BILA|nr:hypothetical protein PENTCL1PPCAC_28510 [Pristionchus entomophagus]
MDNLQSVYNNLSIRELVVPSSLHRPSERAKCACAAEFLRKVSSLRKTTHANDNEFTLVTNLEVEWARLFMEYIMGGATCNVPHCSAAGDDMIWYVPFANAASFYISNNNQVQVVRRQSKKHPTPADPNYNWEETVCLNLIMQQLDFFVTCAVCTKTSPQNLQIIRKNCQQVYPSPSRRRMDSKGEREEITFPKIYFAIDGFEEVFNDVIVRDGECVCVELVARDREGQRESAIFLGSIKYEVLKQVYDTNASSTWQWASKLVRPGGRRQEFVRMRGPRGKGFAEMAVMRVPNCGYETPLVEHNMQFPDFAAAESKFGKRRLSETNLAGKTTMTSSRGSMTPSGSQSARGKRWQSDTDSLNQCPEVEANSIDEELDEGVLTRLWSVRGFGQAWHWLREKKRAECTPLNAFLTYITLSWSDILNDMLNDRHKRPILTFEIGAPPPINS